MKKARMTTTSCGLMFWGGKWDSNPRQPESQSGTLPTELFPPEFEFCGLPGRDRTCDHLLRRQVLYPTELRADRLVSMHVWKLVGVKRFELPTSCSQSRRATTCATPRYFYINFFLVSLFSSLLCPPSCGSRNLFGSIVSLDIPTAAPKNARFFCHRQRSRFSPKAGALPSALHLDTAII